jgi:hypothetical protein
MPFARGPLTVLLCALLVVACGGGGGDDGGGDDDGTAPDAATTPDGDTTPDGPPPCPCAFENGTGHCDAAGMCVIDDCDQGFDDCDDDPATGCETPLDTLTDCGGCGQACALANAATSCATGTCTLEACNAPFADCDLDAMNGCEVDTTADTSHCGGCMQACVLANASEVCANSQCGVDACDPMFRDCNLVPGDGCEIDAATDATNCGTCGNICDFGPHTVPSCANGMCAYAGCEMGWADCNGDMLDGCEHDEAGAGPCVCVPNTTQACYTGTPGTENVGVCKGGVQTCNPDGLGFGTCVGEVTPTAEICANGIDEDCNGVVDDVPDLDGDGWTACNGDCCEDASCATTPKHVNPGAFEVVGNGVDDDCDGTTADGAPAAACSTVQDFTAVTPTQLAQAMDLCQTTTANPPLPQKKWGLVSATFLLANGSAVNATQLNNMQNEQSAVLQGYGTGGVIPTKGATFAGLSSGMMRDQGDPGFVAPNTGLDNATLSTAPAAYLAAHGGAYPAGTCGATPCPVGTGANDPVNVRLVIRVPTNATALTYDYRFFSAEYQTYQCTQFNDRHLALLTSAAPGLPADKDIAATSAFSKPMDVNNPQLSICTGNGLNCFPCSMGAVPLLGTGMQLNNTGAGTPWTTVVATVVPGETITLELMVFDVGDGILDSLVLLDNFRWVIAP